MTNESAAGPKTDTHEDRCERVAASLEKQFHICRRETDAWLANHSGEKGYLHFGSVDDLVKLARVNAQLASAIARIDAARNRNSKTQ